MNKPIKTYNDLVEEKQQLEVLLKAQKELIRYDVAMLKEEARPVLKTFGVVSKLFSRDKTGAILSTGADTLIDVLFKRVLLGRAGWMVRTVVPYFMKNVSSHVLADKKATILRKISSWLKPRHHNGKAPPDPDTTSLRKGANNGDGPVNSAG